jgi:methylmalonyl-CoA/ethylmalonyl-CoA epimerase
MITRIDHVGIVVPSWEEAQHVLLDQFGLEIDEARSRMPGGNYYAPGNTTIYFVKTVLGETDIEVLIPRDDRSGIARYLAKRGPGLHHICYASDALEEDTRLLRERGLLQITAETGDVNPESSPFFHPKSALGILTEILWDERIKPRG